MKKFGYKLGMVMSVLMLLCCASCNKSQNTGDTTSGKVARVNDAPSTGTNAESPLLMPLEEAMANGKPTVIDFYATWCGPCKMISPVFHRLSEKYGADINFVSIDVDEDSRTAARYLIEAMPTFVFLDKGGKEKDRLVGADAEGLKASVEAMTTWN